MCPNLSILKLITQIGQKTISKTSGECQKAPCTQQQVAAETECLNPDNVELQSVLLGHDPQLVAIARSFHTEMNQAGIGGRLYSESLANILNIHLLRHYCTQKIVLRRYKGGLSQHSL